MLNQKALVFIVHGSRRVESNAAMVQLTQSLAEPLKSEYSEVRLAYLELCDPRIEPIVQTLVEEGFANIDLFPYFLAPGNHVREDIPEIMYSLGRKFPDCDLNLLNFLGESNGWAEIVSTCIKSAEQKSE